MDARTAQPVLSIGGPLHLPQSVAEAGVRREVLEDLALKILYVTGQLTLTELADQMRLSYQLANELFQRLKQDRLCEVTGMTGIVYRTAITSQGRARALELLARNQYTGPAPVSLPSYVHQVRAQTVCNFEVHPPDLRRAFASLVLDDDTLDKVGAALNSGSSIFLYGPTGTGKTTIAEKLSRVFGQDQVWIPYAVEVDGQIITVYDPVIHKEAGNPAAGKNDPRWVRCERPTVVVGGELTMEMLDLQFNPSTKYYSSPLQMLANNGVLVIDDFGRQRLRPEELLNRWVVPLDRRIDFLTLAGGKKFEIPFELVVVFATNMNPADLADQAFLRRIQTKIKVDAVSPQQFQEIFQRVCTAAGMECDMQVVGEVIAWIRDEIKEPLRACYPGDIVRQILWAARYQGTQPRVSRESVKRAMDAYFLHGDDSQE